MKTRGRLQRIELPFRAKRPVVTFEVEADPEDVEKYQDMDLDISFSKHRNRRSLDANALLWACLGEMASALRTDNWTMYLYELERYGKFTHILVKPEALESLKSQWRETKVVGETEVLDPATNGYQTMIQVVCFFGSSTYNSSEFSRLLDGVTSDMKDLHLTPPPSQDMRRLIEEMEKKEHDRQERKEHRD